MRALRAAGHLQTIKPIPLRSATPGGFTIHDFRIDHAFTLPLSFVRPEEDLPARGRQEGEERRDQPLLRGRDGEVAA